MFAKFKINSGTIKQLRLQVGKVSLLRQSIVNDAFYNDIVTKVLGNDGVLDGSQLQNLNFPSLRDNYHVFISYSHNDEELALYLASYLQNNCGLNCFLDSTVWHSADSLLKRLDDIYCLNEDGQTYNYNSRNFSTSHVHAMLSMAMHSIINRSECCIVLNSEHSFTLQDGIDNATFSPWLYEEVTFMKGMKISIPPRLRLRQERRSYSLGGQIVCESANPQLQIKYMVDLNMFPNLSVIDLLNLGGQGETGLNNLYRSKRFLRYANR